MQHQTAPSRSTESISNKLIRCHQISQQEISEHRWRESRMLRIDENNDKNLVSVRQHRQEFGIYIYMSTHNTSFAVTKFDNSYQDPATGKASACSAISGKLCLTTAAYCHLIIHNIRKIYQCSGHQVHKTGSYNQAHVVIYIHATRQRNCEAESN